MIRTNRRSRYRHLNQEEGDETSPITLAADPGTAKCCGYKSFQVINVVAMILHLINATWMLAVYYANDREDQWYGLSTPYASWRRLNQTDGPEFEIVQTTATVYVSLNWLVFSFHMLSFLFQGFAALTDLFPKGICGFRYSDMVAIGKNPLRFIEYSISASIMLVCIALLTGIRDINALMIIVQLTAVTQIFGLMCEYLKEQWARNVAHVAGWVTVVSAYGIIIWYYIVAVTFNEVAPPAYVNAIIILQMLLFMSFGFVQLAQLYLGFMYSEVAYTALSIGAKTLLGYMIYANVIMGNDRVREVVVS